MHGYATYEPVERGSAAVSEVWSEAVAANVGDCVLVWKRRDCDMSVIAEEVFV